MLDISVIIVTYNSIDTISESIDSILSQQPESLEVIVIDNASCDGTARLIERHYPQATLIKNRKNMGSAYARNQGINISKGKYLLFLDSDAYLKNDFFRVLNKILNNLPSGIAAISPKILNAHSDRIFSEYCRHF